MQYLLQWILYISAIGSFIGVTIYNGMPISIFIDVPTFVYVGVALTATKYLFKESYLKPFSAIVLIGMLIGLIAIIVNLKSLTGLVGASIGVNLLLIVTATLFVGYFTSVHNILTSDHKEVEVIQRGKLFWISHLSIIMITVVLIAMSLNITSFFMIQNAIILIPAVVSLVVVKSFVKKIKLVRHYLVITSLLIALSLILYVLLTGNNESEVYTNTLKTLLTSVVLALYVNFILLRSVNHTSDTDNKFYDYLLLVVASSLIIYYSMDIYNRANQMEKRFEVIESSKIIDSSHNNLFNDQIYRVNAKIHFDFQSEIYPYLEKSLLQNIVDSYFSSISKEKLFSMVAQESIKEELAEKINSTYGKSVVRGIYFSKLYTTTESAKKINFLVKPREFNEVLINFPTVETSLYIHTSDQLYVSASLSCKYSKDIYEPLLKAKASDLIIENLFHFNEREYYSVTEREKLLQNIQGSLNSTFDSDFVTGCFFRQLSLVREIK